jgi:phospholipase C
VHHGPLRFALLSLISFVSSHSLFAACTATTEKTVAICAPASGATVATPVQITANALDTTKPVTAMVAYVDSVKQASGSTANLNASLSLTAGKHSLTVRAWDSSGVYFSSSESFTVAGTVVTPTVSMTANPASITSGQGSTLTITATNATSIQVTDNIDSQVWTVPSTGGSVTVTPTATTTYAATATSSSGNTATSSSTVTVSSGTPGGNGINAVNHVIFYLHENRSFDSYLGMLNPYRQANNLNVGDDGKVYTVDGIDDKLQTVTNKNDEGQSFYLFHTTSSCLDDMSSAWLESYGDVNRYNFSTSRPMLMDGFVHTAENFGKSGSATGSVTDLTGQRAMAYYQDTSTMGTPELNYFYYMASQFALSDRWFSPVASKTIPNRIATLSGGTTQGYTHDPGKDDKAPQLGAKTIFQLLDQNNISWKIYYEQTNADGSPATEFTYFSYANKYIYKNSSGAWVIDSTHVAPISQYYTDVSAGTLPAFAYIDKKDGGDEHPGSGTSILPGQQNAAKIINALMYSPSWKDSVMFMSYDEAGGPYDHVPPVPGHTNDNTDAALKADEGDVSSIAVNPDGYLPCVPTTAGVYSNHCDLRPADPGAHTGDAAAAYGFAAQIGFRVPNMIISPFARRHYVGHTPMDHTAVLHFLEQRYNLPALTKRDAAQPNLLDFFDFATPPWATPPAQSSLPTPPAVGSTCHPATMQ